MKCPVNALLAAALILSGCSSDSGPAKPPGAAGERGTLGAAGPAAESPGSPAEPSRYTDSAFVRDSGPAGAADAGGRTVSGTVASIVGNEVTLTLDQPAGETAVFLLPVGMPIGRGDFSSVTAGNRLRIRFDPHPTDVHEIIVSVEATG